MSSPNPAPTKLDSIAPAVQALLDGSDLTIEQLAAHLADGPVQSTGNTPAAASVADAVAAATRALKPGAVKTYRTYWRVLEHGIVLPASWDRPRLDRYAEDLVAVDREQRLNLEVPTDIHACERHLDGGVIVFPGHGDQPLDAISPFDIEVMTKWVRANALARGRERDRCRARKGRPPTRNTGKGAEENFIAAIRCLYRAAGKNGMVGSSHSPAAAVRKPARRAAPSRRSMIDAELRDVWVTVSSTGRDPELDAMIFRLQMETASRQEGCINLKLHHLDDERQSVWLDQKGDEVQEFPVSAALLRDLRAFAVSRGSVDPYDPVLRQKGRHRRTGALNPPLTGRRFDHIHERVQQQHRWAGLAGWTSHWVRHHCAAQIEAIGGRPCKMRILGHKPNGQTDGYGQATFEHLAWAVAVATGEPHPLAQRPPWVNRG